MIVCVHNFESDSVFLYIQYKLGVSRLDTYTQLILNVYEVLNAEMSCNLTAATTFFTSYSSNTGEIVIRLEQRAVLQ